VAVYILLALVLGMSEARLFVDMVGSRTRRGLGRRKGA
jgi:hypothetical protein